MAVHASDLLGGMMADTKIEWVIGPDGKRGQGTL